MAEVDELVNLIVKNRNVPNSAQKSKMVKNVKFLIYKEIHKIAILNTMKNRN